MPKLRTFDEHLQLYTAFAHAVSTFEATTWDRISARCTAFDEVSLLAAFERAQIRARPHGYPISRLVAALPDPLPLPVRVIAGMSTLVQTGIAFGFELTQLVPAMREAAWRPSATSALSQSARRYSEADYAVNHSLDALSGPSLGVRAAIHAAGAAVLYHDFLSDHDFAISYEVVAPELSFAELERRAIGV